MRILPFAAAAFALLRPSCFFFSPRAFFFCGLFGAGYAGSEPGKSTLRRVPSPRASMRVRHFVHRVLFHFLSADRQYVRPIRAKSSRR